MIFHYNRYTTFCLSIHSLMATFRLLWIILVWTLMLLFRHMLLSSLSYILRSHMVTLCLTFWGIDKLFKADTPFYNSKYCPLLKNCVYFFLLLSCKTFLYILDTNLRYMICKYFLHFCGLSFQFLYSVLWSTKILNF